MDKNLNYPEVSVVMPVYNAEKYLRDAIESILNQSFRNFEFFIIDDASTDKSVEIIKSFSDNRIFLIQKAVNSGYTDSLNMAIKLAKGKYIARMDADDISLKNRFLMQYQYMESNTSVLVLGTFFNVIGSNIITHSLAVTNNQTKVHLFTRSANLPPNRIYKKKYFFH